MTAIFAPIRMIEDQLAALVARNGIFAGDPGRSGRTEPDTPTRARSPRTATSPSPAKERQGAATLPRSFALAKAGCGRPAGFAPAPARPGRVPATVRPAGPSRAPCRCGGVPGLHPLPRWLESATGGRSRPAGCMALADHAGTGKRRRRDGWRSRWPMARG